MMDDDRILRALSPDGYRPFADVAQRLGLSFGDRDEADELLVALAALAIDGKVAFIHGRGYRREGDNAPRRAGVEVLVVRDPDDLTEVTVFVDGQRVETVQEHVDPGAGWLTSGWDEDTEAVAEELSYSPTFRAAVVAARDEHRDSEHVINDDDNEEGS